MFPELVRVKACVEATLHATFTDVGLTVGQPLKVTVEVSMAPAGDPFIRTVPDTLLGAALFVLVSVIELTPAAVVNVAGAGRPLYSQLLLADPRLHE